MLLALALLASLSTADWPKDDSPSPVEDAKLGPLEVCNAMSDAAKKNDFDALIGHTTAYVRTRFGRKEKLAIEGMHSLLVGVRCVRVSKEDDDASPPRAMIWIYAPQNKSRDLPFVKEHGFWRFDYDQYRVLHGSGTK
jgi:hypothetical protein